MIRSPLISHFLKLRGLRAWWHLQRDHHLARMQSAVETVAPIAACAFVAVTSSILFFKLRSPAYISKRRNSVVYVVPDSPTTHGEHISFDEQQSSLDDDTTDWESISRKDSTDAPLQLILRTLSRFSKGELTQTELAHVLRDLSSPSSLYEPNYDILFHQVNSAEDRQWLLSEYSGACRKSLSADASNKRKFSLFPGLSRSQISLLLKKWDFDVFRYTEHQLFSFIVSIFNELELLSTFKIDETVLRNFIFEVRRRYHNNPYHNFTHAFDVFQTVYYFLISTNASEYLEHIDVLALLVAALCHDIDHPGTTNNFHIATLSPTAVTYNDLSVLENYHAATTFRLLLSSPEVNILAHLSRDEFKRVRHAIIHLILATDMSKHFEKVNLLKTRLETGLFSKQNSEDILLLQALLLHAADISNPAKPFEISKRWSDLLIGEFVAQGDLERKHGLEVSPGMDSSKINQPSMSVNFIEYIVLPLYEAMRAVLPALDAQCDQLRANRQRWRQMMASPVNPPATTQPSAEAP